MPIQIKIVVVALVLVLVIVASIFMLVMAAVKKRRSRRDKQFQGLLRTLPSFGPPRRVTYTSESFEGRLRCAGNACGHRFILEGEEFLEIPLLGRTDNAMLSVCLPCSTQIGNPIKG
jgi:hypothetical protein